MTLSEKLTEMAEEFDANAAVWEAEVKTHVLNGEAAEVRRKGTRARKGRTYAETCRHAAKLLKAREKRGAFVPPEWGEVLIYTREATPYWPEQDVQKWFDHFNSNGWRVGGKAQMADWKAAARNGARNWKEKNPQAVAKKDGGDNPEHWLTFCLAHSIKPEPYKYAAAHMKTDFAKWLKGQQR